MGTGVMLDIDGVLVVSWKVLPGAMEVVDWLRTTGIRFRLVTNTSSRTRRQIAELLTEAGLQFDVDEIVTAVSGAASYLAQYHPGARCFVLNEGDITEDLDGIDVVGPGSADVVLLGGAGPSVDYSELDAAFKLITAGIPVIAFHRNTKFQTVDGPALDMGAFVIGLEAATGVAIEVVGKPAPAFYEAVLSELGTLSANTVMVGDDIVSDVLGAQTVGITGVLVKTGKFRPSDLDGTIDRPDYVIADIGQFPNLFVRLL
jgi:HAD superfamily hydrolase (TIGR01458 family)